MNLTLEDIKNMETWEFQEWVRKSLSAKSVKPSSRAYGFNGIISFISHKQFDGALIRMEQFAHVGEPIIKTTRERMIIAEKNTAFIIAPSFTERAIKLVSEYRKHGKGNIHLVTLESIMNKTPDEIFETIDYSGNIVQECGE